MAARLFVGNLPYSVDSQKLEEIFSQAGPVASAQVLIDRMTGRSRGFGFVEMADDEGTQKAIDMINNMDVDGRKIVVNVARPREERSDNRSGGGYGSDRPRYGNDRPRYGGDRRDDRRGGGRN